MNNFKKYILMVILLINVLLLLNFKVKADSSEDVWANEKTLEEISTYSFLETDYNGTNGLAKSGGQQGFCFINDEKTKFIRVLFSNTSDSTGAISNIEIIDTSKNINTLNRNFYIDHGNDCTYNPNTKEILIVSSYEDSSGFHPRLTKYKLNDAGNDLVEVGTVTNFGFNGSISSIAYDKDHDQYIISHLKVNNVYGSEIVITDSNFSTVKKRFDLPSNFIDQGIAYWNNYLYATYFENGLTIKSKVDANGKTTYSALTDFEKERFGGAVIYVYNLNGSFIREFWIPRRNLMSSYLNKLDYVPEIESIDFQNNGNIVLAYTYFLGISNSYYEQNPSSTPTKKLVLLESPYIKHNSLNVKSISISNLPEKTEYTAESNESLSVAGGKLQITYYDDTTSELNLTSSDIHYSGYDNSTAGTKTITVSYAGKETTFNILVKPPVIESIRIKQMPTKQQYFVGASNIDLTGGIIETVFSNGSTGEIPLDNENVTISGFNSSSAGPNTITVNYAGKETTFNLQIIDKEVERIEIIEEPIKQFYVKNSENLDLTGGILKITFNDGTTSNIPLTDEEITVTGFDNTTTGSKTITVKYHNKQTTFNVEIIDNTSKEVASIEIKNLPIKMKYVQYLEQLDLTGGVLKIIFTDGSTGEIPLTSEDITITGFNGNTLGKNTITVKYQNKEITFDVNIIELTPSNTVVNVPDTAKNISIIIFSTGIILIGLGTFVISRKIKSIKIANNI